MMKKRGFSRKINYGVIGSAYESRGSTASREESRRGSESGSKGPEVSLSPEGEILVEGVAEVGGRDVDGGEGQAVDGAKEGSVPEAGGGEKGKGASREEAIEVEEGESDADDYYDTDDDMEMAGVDEVLGRLEESDDGEDALEGIG
ncbi:MAG: hypothetical protein L6R41_006914 [Letrouitia leprolyta]|nr:MAG: hypothetical protein L6R41_006914 [Letrouitia leprolyta]